MTSRYTDSIEGVSKVEAVSDQSLHRQHRGRFKGARQSVTSRYTDSIEGVSKVQGSQ